MGYNARPFYLLTGGYVLKIDKHWAVKTTAQLRNYPGLPWQYDANVYAMYNDELSIGYGYRSNQAHSFMAQLKVNDYFYLVYMYERGFVYDNKTAFYSQEFGLRYDVDFNKQRVKVSPRYY
jgi:hypothetical protein